MWSILLTTLSMSISIYATKSLNETVNPPVQITKNLVTLKMPQVIRKYDCTKPISDKHNEKTKGLLKNSAAMNIESYLFKRNKTPNPPIKKGSKRLEHSGKHLKNEKHDEKLVTAKMGEDSNRRKFVTTKVENIRRSFVEPDPLNSFGNAIDFESFATLPDYEDPTQAKPSTVTVKTTNAITTTTRTTSAVMNYVTTPLMHIKEKSNDKFNIKFNMGDIKIAIDAPVNMSENQMLSLAQKMYSNLMDLRSLEETNKHKSNNTLSNLSRTINEETRVIQLKNMHPNITAFTTVLQKPNQILPNIIETHLGGELPPETTEDSKTQNTLLKNIDESIGETTSQVIETSEVSEVSEETLPIFENAVETVPKKQASFGEVFHNKRILCLVMTEHERHKTNAIHVKATWGSKCDKLVFMSNAKDIALPTIKLYVAQGRNHLWEKTRAALTYVHRHYRNEADWFLRADDDTFVIIENLHSLLEMHDENEPMYFGCRFKPFTKQGYMSGGAGYVMSRAALYRLNRAFQIPNMCNTVETSAEDVELGKCMERIGVRAMDSRDAQERERFYPFPPQEHLLPHNDSSRNWYNEYLYYTPKNGVKCCSNSPITFHGIRGRDMYVLNYLIYQLQPQGPAVLDDNDFVKPGTHLSIETPALKTAEKYVPLAEIQFNSI